MKILEFDGYGDGKLMFQHHYLKVFIRAVYRKLEKT